MLIYNILPFLVVLFLILGDYKLFRVMGKDFAVGLLFGGLSIVAITMGILYTYEKYLQHILGKKWEINNGSTELKVECIEFNEKETCNWLNKAILPVLTKVLSKNLTANMDTIFSDIMDRFDEKRPDFVDKFQLINVNITEFSVIVEEIHSNSIDNNRADLSIKFFVEGNVAIKVSSNIMINYPVPNFCYLPIIMNIFFRKAAGTMFIRADKNNEIFNLSLREYPENNLRIEPEVGGYIVLSKLIAVEKYLLLVIKSYIQSKLVEPQCIEVNLHKFLKEQIEKEKEINMEIIGYNKSQGQKLDTEIIHRITGIRTRSEDLLD